MSAQASLLIELGTEELPVKALPELARAFFDGIVKGLEKRFIGIGMHEAGRDAKCYYTPRRIAVFLPWVSLQQPTLHSAVPGPTLNIAHDPAGNPTPALLGFAKKQGVSVADLVLTDDGQRFVAKTTKPGLSTASLLREIVLEAIAAMPIPKPMRWGDHDYAFARPVHWLVMLLGADVVDAEVFGVRADRMSRGHRFHHPEAVSIVRAEDYLDALRAAQVLADPDERRARIRSEVETVAQSVDGFARVSDSLVEEVNCLVEWPRAILCGFDHEFLRVPHEALISTMETNQKFFPVLNSEHRMTEHFVGISNIDSADPAEVRKGYERVIRPRFADAQFFFDEDVKQGLDSMREGLASVTYQQKLGSYADKTARVAALCEALALEFHQEVQAARRAAELSKADLLSRMVGEFPELQGIAGSYYASAAGEPGVISDAIDQAYMPRFAGDAIAPSELGRLLAIADRLDTLSGGFAAGLKPTGNKDPFALRRAALGLVRTCIEGEIDLKLDFHLDFAISQLPTGLSASSLELREFVYDRLRSYYVDKEFTVPQINAVAELRAISLLDFDRRLKAIREFAKLPEAEALAAANKRIRNILKKSADAIPATVDPSLFEGDAERALHAAIEAAIADTDPLLAQRDYVGALTRLAGLRPQVDAFFDGVMVNVEDARVRGNRLALLKQLADRLGSVAAIEYLSI
jgi:glycyl-tRNA synthetase beta chain